MYHFCISLFLICFTVDLAKNSPYLFLQLIQILGLGLSLFFPGQREWNWVTNLSRCWSTVPSAPNVAQSRKPVQFQLQTAIVPVTDLETGWGRLTNIKIVLGGIFLFSAFTRLQNVLKKVFSIYFFQRFLQLVASYLWKLLYVQQSPHAEWNRCYHEWWKWSQLGY